jgi:putative hydrolase of the HAD superfamily
VSVNTLVGPDVRAVFFDAVGTLIHPSPGAVRMYADAAARRGVDLPADTVRGRFVAAFRAEEEVDRAAGWVTSEEREEARWRRIVADTLPEVPGCFADLYEHFARPTAWAVDPDAAAVFAALAGRGIAVGLGSNYDHRLETVIDGHPVLAGLRPRVVISSRVGWRKPGRAFFDAVVAAAGCPAGAILFVGDDRENDFDGAAAAGLRPVMLDPAGRHADARPRIGRLAELV